ncbi:putative U-box domain-containing protein 4 [Iris pallida]|uniref:U-box domain-containing protein 4 n=1 Tax=Iris pallida TaxID=29817 RepID=A0AAX6HB83_IRIPA|nr:putative U-box domain-containing protein 4 [Iris pallida]
MEDTKSGMVDNGTSLLSMDTRKGRRTDVEERGGSHIIFHHSPHSTFLYFSSFSLELPLSSRAFHSYSSIASNPHLPMERVGNNRKGEQQAKMKGL